jgi:phytoene dehydrogenase-like protein
MQNGGTVMTNKEVREIQIEDGRATGVTLRDGTEIGARRCVVSAVNPHLTYDDFIGLEHLSEDIAQKVEGWDYNVWTLYGAHFSLHEPPKLSVADNGVPEANHALKQMIGIESTDDLDETFDHVLNKERPPKPSFGAGSLTLFDETQAPGDKHTAYAWWPAPHDLEGDPDNWQAEEDEWLDAVLEKWGEYAPNMTEDNVIHSYSYTPREIPLYNPNMAEGDIFVGELAADQVNTGHFSYRTPIDGLYMCGSCTHPGGSLHGATAYNAVKEIHEDLGVDIWWEPMSLRDSLKALD